MLNIKCKTFSANDKKNNWNHQKSFEKSQYFHSRRLLYDICSILYKC